MEWVEWSEVKLLKPFKNENIFINFLIQLITAQIFPILLLKIFQSIPYHVTTYPQLLIVHVNQVMSGTNRTQGAMVSFIWQRGIKM